MADPLVDLVDAVQRFIAATEDDPAVVTAAVLVVELARYDDDGEELRRITYTTPSDLASLSSTLGLLEAGRHIVVRDIVAFDEGSDE